MALTTGEILQGRYRIVSLLGQGGMGAVYRAWDTRLNLPVALKETTPQPGLDPHTLAQLRQQFQQEAQILARLNHPHLVRVGDFFEERGNAYLVMDFIEGEGLAELIEHEEALPEDRVLVWAEQLLDALGYCHAQGVIHRDVKPQNVIIRPDGRAVLVDFGLVKLWDPHDPRTRTAMRGVGTPEYAPPEQYDAEVGHTDARSDIYSLGATLYHALTGQAPPTATMRMADPEQFMPLRDVVPGVSERVETAVMKALELARSQRWQGVAEMAQALGLSVPVWAGEKVVEQAVPLATGRGGTRKMEAEALEEDLQEVQTTAQPVVAEITAVAAPEERVPPTSGVRWWVWALAGLAVLVVGFLLFGGGLIGAWLSFSQLEPTVASVATKTPRPTLTPSPTATATMVPTSMPPLGVRILWSDDFSGRALTGWEQYENIEVENGLACLTAYGEREPSLSRVSYGLVDASGASFSFKANSEAVFEVFVDSGEWERPTYRRWGLFVDMEGAFSDTWQGEINERQWLLNLDPDTWYQARLEIRGDGEFVLQVWKRGDPSMVMEHREMKGDDWRGLEWHSVVQVFDGVVELDDYYEFSLAIGERAAPEGTAEHYNAVAGFSFFYPENWKFSSYRYGSSGYLETPGGFISMEAFRGPVSQAFDTVPTTSEEVVRTAADQWLDGAQNVEMGELQPVGLGGLTGSGLTFSLTPEWAGGEQFTVSLAGVLIDDDTALLVAAVTDEETPTNMESSLNTLLDSLMLLEPQQPRTIEAGPMEYGESRSGEVGPGDTCVYRFHGEEGDLVTTRVGAGDDRFDSYLELADGDGVVLVSNDAGGETLDASIQRYRLPSGGTYHIHVSGSDGMGGAFVVSLALEEGQPADELQTLAPITHDKAASVENLRTLHSTGFVETVAFSPLGGLLAWCGEGGIWIWNLDIDGLEERLTGHSAQVHSVAFDPDGQVLISSGAEPDRTIRIWDVASGQQLRVLDGHQGGVTVAVSPRGDLIASASGYELWFWNSETGERIKSLVTPDWLYCPAFSPDGNLLAVGDEAGTVQIRSTRDGRLLRTLRGHTGHVGATAFSPDGDILASGSWDGIVRVWSSGDGALIQTLEWHTDEVRCVAFSPDGTVLASGSEDGTIIFWGISDGELLAILDDHTSWVQSLAFSPDGTLLASGSNDGTVRLWGVR
jgi:WD40 repeat protein/tRNA A-37 threonylcarbamoyl transferase component Bud32